MVSETARRIVFLLAALAAILLAAAAVYAPHADAAQSSGYVLNGYAWSDTIGWISMNCKTGGPSGNNICGKSDYVVRVDQDGNLSGYGWSDNIGWVSANEDDLSGCPGGPCAAKLDFTGKKLTGWMRALSGGTAGSGGWDGFMSLSGSAQSGDAYGITLAGNVFSGYAWGSMNVGWTYFSHVQLEQCSGNQCSDTGFSCTLRVRPSGIKRDESATLRWTSRGASSFQIAPDIGAVTPVASGTRQVHPNTSTIYTGTAKDASANEFECTAELTVCATPPGYWCKKNKLMHTDDACRIEPIGCAKGETCTDYGDGIAECVADSPEIRVHLIARPALVRRGEPSNLYWDVYGATSCTVHGSNGETFSGLSSGDGGRAPRQTASITERTTYTLACLPAGALPTESATINVAPSFREL